MRKHGEAGRHGMLLCVLCAAVLGMAVSCDVDTGSFDAYAGTNLIAAHPFDGGTEGGWRSLDQAAPSGDFRGYLVYQTVDTTDVPAAAYTEGTEPVARLEIPNLIENGQFTSDPIAPDGHWVISGESAEVLRQPDDVSGAAPQGGGSMLVDLDADFSNRVELDLTRALLDIAVEDDIIPDSRYLFYLRSSLNEDTRAQNFGFYDEPSFNLNQLEDDEVWTVESTGTEPDTRDFPTADVWPEILPDEEAAAQVFFLAGGMNATIDDLRFVRSDSGVNAYLALDLPVHSPGSDRLDLPSGHYRFSLQVRQDPQASDLADRRTSSAVLIRMVQLRGGVPIASVEMVHSSDDWFSDWTELTIETIEDGFSLFDDDILRVKIQPSVFIQETESGNRGRIAPDAGSVLIAAPRLEFLPD